MIPTISDLRTYLSLTINGLRENIRKHRCCHETVDGFFATKLTGDEDLEFREVFEREFLPLVNAMKHAQAAYDLLDNLLRESPDTVLEEDNTPLGMLITHLMRELI
jgi:hypothetical protein